MNDETDQATDQVLAADLQGRSIAAWAKVYDRHASDVYRFVAHLLHEDQLAAQEVHQEIWLAALAGIDSFDAGRGELRAWIFGIARRQVALHFRRRGTKPGEQNGNLVDHDPVDEQTILPVELLSAVERCDAVHAALAELGSETRDVLLAKYVTGLSVKELAARFGRTPKAIESLLSRGRSRLRSLLRWYFDNEPHSTTPSPTEREQ